MRKIIKIFNVMILSFIFVLSGCGRNSSIDRNNDDFRSVNSSKELSNFYFETILVYCPLNLEGPIMEIKDIFEKETGCEVQVNSAPVKSLKEQLKISKKGEVFISESNDSTEDISLYVYKTKELVGHKPVLAVKKNNFAGVNSLDSLMENGVFISFSDFDSGIGGVSEKFLKLCSERYDFYYADNIKEEVIYKALDEYDNCAVVVWKETCDTEKFDIIEIAELDELYQPINAIMLKCSEADEATREFISFLNSNEARDVFSKYGYIVN